MERASLSTPSSPIPIATGISYLSQNEEESTPKPAINRSYTFVQRAREEEIRRRDESVILEGVQHIIDSLAPRDEKQLLLPSQEGLLKVLRKTVDAAIKSFSKTILLLKDGFLHSGVSLLNRDPNWKKIREQAIERIFKVIFQSHGKDNQKLFLQEPTVIRLFAIVMNEPSEIKKLLPEITT